MKPKFLDLDKIYNLHLDEKIVTPKHLPLQGFVIATLVNSFGRSTLAYKNIVRKCYEDMFFIKNMQFNNPTSSPLT